MDIEIWKDISGYEDIYQVSNYGRVKSKAREIYRSTTIMHLKEKILKCGINQGYKVVCLRNLDKNVWISVHRLVAQAFIPNPDNLPCINHRNEDKLNNHVNNLEWCTYSYNNSYNDLAKRKAMHVDYKKRAANTDWEARKMHTDFAKRTANTDYKAIGLKHRKPIYQYDMRGNFIKRWESVYDICNELDVRPEAIRANCLGAAKNTKGYQWRYEKDVRNK